MNHAAYPILHYFYIRRSQYSAVVGVAILDETLTLLRFGVPEGTRANGATVRGARSRVENYLEMVDETFAPADEAPPAPDLAALREAGIPTVSDGEFAAAVDGTTDRRRRLLGLVKANARRWPGTDDE